MQQAQQLVGVGEPADPRVPRRVLDAVGEARHQEEDDERRVRRVAGDARVRREVADRPDDGHPALPEVAVDPVVEERRRRVAAQRREEDEGDDGVVEVVVDLELPCA